MGKKVKTAITPTREEDYASWYTGGGKSLGHVGKFAGPRMHGDKTLGICIWENIQRRNGCPVQGDRGKKTPISHYLFP